MHLVMTTPLRGGHDYFRIGMLLSLGSQRVLIRSRICRGVPFIFQFILLILPLSYFTLNIASEDGFRLQSAGMEIAYGVICR